MFQANGLVPVQHPHVPDRERIAVDPAGGQNLYIHDPVVLNASGKIVRATAGGAMIGVINSFHGPDRIPQIFYPAGETGWFAEVNTWEHQQYEIQDLTVALEDPADRGMNINFRFETVNEVIPVSGAVLNAGSKTTAATGQLRLIEPVLRDYPFRIFQNENTMLKYDPDTRIRGRQDLPAKGEVVYRQDLEEWYYALNTDNSAMSDWAVCAIGETAQPVISWIVQINNHQRVTTTGI